jgi:hypothetical protein
MLKCTKCNEYKEETAFPIASVKLSGRAGECKECKAKRTKKQRDERAYILYKERGKKCAICGIKHSNPGFFDWHHIDETTKKYEVKTMINSKWERVIEEANKCIMLCPNCHRKEHLND